MKGLMSILLAGLLVCQPALACQTVCQNCQIAELKVNSDGSILLDFTNLTSNGNPDGCAATGSILSSPSQSGFDQLYSALLAAHVANKAFSSVRSCGCDVHNNNEYPKLAWFRF